MADFYVDHDVSVEVGDLLREQGHTAHVARDIGATTHNDAQHLLAATETFAAVLVTHNFKDFLLLHRAWRLWTAQWQLSYEHAGILVLPHGPEPTSLQRLLGFLQLGWPTRNMLYRYHPQSGWVQRD